MKLIAATGNVTVNGGMLSASHIIGDVQVLSGNPQHVVDYFLSMIPIDPRSDTAYILNLLGGLSDTQINDTLNQLHPAFLGALFWIHLDNTASIAALLDSLTKDLVLILVLS